MKLPKDLSTCVQGSWKTTYDLFTFNACNALLNQFLRCRWPECRTQKLKWFKTFFFVLQNENNGHFFPGHLQNSNYSTLHTTCTLVQVHLLSIPTLYTVQTYDLWIKWGAIFSHLCWQMTILSKKLGILATAWFNR